MPVWFDSDKPYTLEELAWYLEVDERFFKVAVSAGLTLDSESHITARSFWLWLSSHFEEFRSAAGMRALTLKKTLRGAERDRARAEAAVQTVAEFFGVLPCEKAMTNASAVLFPKRTRKRL